MQTIRNTREDIQDRLMNVLYGATLELPECTQEWAEDIMNRSTRVDINVDSIPDCDSREDFIELNQLTRIHDNAEADHYLLEGYF